MHTIFWPNEEHQLLSFIPGSHGVSSSVLSYETYDSSSRKTTFPTIRLVVVTDSIHATVFRVRKLGTHRQIPKFWKILLPPCSRFNLVSPQKGRRVSQTRSQSQSFLFYSYRLSFYVHSTAISHYSVGGGRILLGCSLFSATTCTISQLFHE